MSANDHEKGKGRTGVRTLKYTFFVIAIIIIFVFAKKILLETSVFKKDGQAETNNNPKNQLGHRKNSILQNYLRYHQPAEESSRIIFNPTPLPEAYQQGKLLYLSQACYSCHNSSNSSKETLVDLKKSHIPTYSLDPGELENLIAFLSSSQAEDNLNLLWEKSISPEKILDIKNSMIIFATEGCASCHQLRGFDSNVLFSVQLSENRPSFDVLYHESEWFHHLFPEQISAEALIDVIDQNAKEIDLHIVSQKDKAGTLEEIERLSPGILKTFYENFSLALRFKRDAYTKKIGQEKDPEKKKEILLEKAEWEERFQRILMIYIQEYGLGRVLGPSLDWVGIYRTDQWLMRYFHQPRSEIVDAQMPAFPFDKTKFYALTFMLDALSKKNNDHDHQVWQLRGFNPEKAYNLYCAQCHGKNLTGNGPVAQWIHPIPKNLSNPVLMRNLTQEIAIGSTLNIKWSPMPPWGKVAEGKNNTPVLSKAQTKLIVEWIFEQMPGDNQIAGFQKLPKWTFSPQEIITELHKEGNQLTGFPSKDLSNETEEYKRYFDIKPPVIGRPAFYFKKKYYTQQNIKAGRLFYEKNCAICHGKNGNGDGTRGDVLTDALPRDFYDTEWLSTQDDLSLFRSIKYGKPGTAMAAWGDSTNSLQRIQLVLFIRSLSYKNTLEKELSHALQESFGNVEEFIVKAYSKEALAKNGSLDNLYTQLLNNLDQEIELYRELGSSFIRKVSIEQNEDLFLKFLKIIQLNKNLFRFNGEQLEMQSFQAQKEMQNQFIQLLTDTIQNSYGTQKKDYIELNEEAISIFSRINTLEIEQKQVVSDLNKASI